MKLLSYNRLDNDNGLLRINRPVIWPSKGQKDTVFLIGCHYRACREENCSRDVQ